MNIRPSAAIRQNYNEIADLCKKNRRTRIPYQKWRGRFGGNGY